MNLLCRIQLTILLMLIFILISCTSTSVEQVSGNIESSVNPGTADKYMDPVIVDGEIDFTNSAYSFLWDTSPDNGSLLFSSFVPRMAYRDEEVELAVAEAARQVSILYNAKVDAKFAVKSNNRDLGYLEAIDIQYDRALAGDLKDRIKLRYHFRDNEGTYILSELDGINFRGSFPVVRGEGNTPDWLNNVPGIPGYLVSIGIVQRSRYKIDSIRKADEQALASLAKQVSIVVKAKRTDLESEVSGSAFSETNYEVTSTFINGFYVLGRWSTDNGNTYYTLAVCPVDQ